MSTSYSVNIIKPTTINSKKSFTLKIECTYKDEIPVTTLT